MVENLKIASAEPEAGSKGAGVGFIEIARRASKPIAFDFAEVDDQFAFMLVVFFRFAHGVLLSSVQVRIGIETTGRSGSRIVR